MSDFERARDIEWEPGGAVGRVSYYEGDKALAVEFYRKSEPNGLAAIQSGGPAFVAKDYVRIYRPAEMKIWTVDREATEHDKRRFPRHWDAYKESRAQIPDGYPIALLFPNDPDRVDIMRGHRIHTIEQLAGVSDGAVGRLGMGGRELVEQAKEYLERAGDREQWAAMQQAREQDQAVIAALKAQMAELSAMVQKREGMAA